MSAGVWLAADQEGRPSFSFLIKLAALKANFFLIINGCNVFKYYHGPIRLDYTDRVRCGGPFESKFWNQNNVNFGYP